MDQTQQVQHKHRSATKSKIQGAMVLAAGSSRRLQPFVSDRPKCLLEFGGATLLERHARHLLSLGVMRMQVVTGYCSEQIEGEVARILPRLRDAAPDFDVEIAHNAEYQQGSVLSLQTGLRAWRWPDGLLMMDADVLYHPEVLSRLVCAAGTAFLLDETSQETGEEMMLGVRGNRVLRIARRVSHESWDLVGETVGFMKLGAEHRQQLEYYVNQVVEEGNARCEYEEAVGRLLPEIDAGYVSVGDLAWTEIDFEADVIRARDVILPRLPPLDRWYVPDKADADNMRDNR